MFRRRHDAPHVIDKAALPSTDLASIALVASSTPQTMDLKQEDAQDPDSKDGTPVQQYIDISSDDARGENDMHAGQIRDDVSTDTTHVRHGTMIKLEAQDNENHEDLHNNQEDAKDETPLSALTRIPPYDWQALYEDFDAAMRKQYEVEQDIQNETKRLMQVCCHSLWTSL